MADDRISLCLSGGGLRATLFHLGLVKAMRACTFKDKPALECVSEIYSVSGGSILAAHMALCWTQYVGTDAEFAKVEAEILAFAQRNIRDRVLRRSALTFLPLRLWNLASSRFVSGRAHWLMREYEALLGKVRIDEVFTTGGSKPSFNILSTNFKTGELCAFSGVGFEVERRDGSVLATPCGHLSLSRAVAASSAFPPMFPPLLLDDRLLSRPRDDAFLQPLLLSDGGVYDNLGVEKFWRNRGRNPKAPSTVIISNAGSPFRAEASKTYAGPLSRNVRASDILMHRVADNAEKAIAAASGIDDIVVGLTASVAEGTLDSSIQQPLRMVRTDLDRFGGELAAMLVEHGKEVARQEFAARKEWSWTGAAGKWPNTPTERTRQERIALKAEGRSFWMLPFDLRDWLPLLLLWSIALFAGWQAYRLWDGYRDAKAAEQAAEDLARTQREELLNTKIAELNRANNAMEQGDFVSARRIVLNAIGKSDIEQRAIRQEAAAAPAATPIPAAVDLQTPQVDYPQPVYIQFAGRITRQQIVALNSALRANGWKVDGPSGERIATAAGLNEVRFAGDNRRAAEELAAAITSAGVGASTVRVRQTDIVGPLNLEVWISN